MYKAQLSQTDWKFEGLCGTDLQWVSSPTTCATLPVRNISTFQQRWPQL